MREKVRGQREREREAISEEWEKYKKPIFILIRSGSKFKLSLIVDCAAIYSDLACVCACMR